MAREQVGGEFAQDLGSLWAAIGAPFRGDDVRVQGPPAPAFAMGQGGTVGQQIAGLQGQLFGSTPAASPYDVDLPGANWRQEAAGLPTVGSQPDGGQGPQGLQQVYDPESGTIALYWNGVQVGGLDKDNKPWYLPGFGGGAKATGGGSGANLGYGGMLSFDQQMEMQGSQQEANKLLAELQAQSAERIAQINADTSLSAQEKQVQIAEINRGSAREAAEIAAGAQRYIAELDAQSEQKRIDAEKAIAEGNLQLGYAQLESSERIAAAKAQLEREVAGLEAYTQLLGIESTERANRAQAAASVFKSLADATPGEMLRSAWYFTRGQAPPPTLAEKMPRGLLSALGVNPDTVSAAAQEMRGQTSTPPFLLQLMQGQMQQGGTA